MAVYKDPKPTKMVVLSLVIKMHLVLLNNIDLKDI